MKKYPKISEFGSEDISNLQGSGDVIIEEKLDGANVGVKLNNDGFLFRSRNVVGLNGNREQFQQTIDYVNNKTTPEEMSQILCEHFGHNNLTLFGEQMVPHALEYDWENMPDVLWFDIYDEENEQFVSYAKKQLVFEDLNFDMVPLITIVGHVSPKDIEVPDSEYRDGKAEGVVLKCYGTQFFSKKRAEEFFEKRDKVYGKPKGRAADDNEKFVSKYVTNHRIEKNIYKIRDEYNRNIQMEIMPQLMDTVYKDIWSEEWDEIIWNNWELNFKEIRNMVGTRCEEVLRQVINREAFK